MIDILKDKTLVYNDIEDREGIPYIEVVWFAHDREHELIKITETILLTKEHLEHAMFQAKDGRNVMQKSLDYYTEQVEGYDERIKKYDEVKL